MMKKIVLCLIFSASVLFAQSYKDLIGSWQVTNHVAAGYNDAFTFNEDGTFSFHYNQMDCAKREISYSGSWELDGKKIILIITIRVRLSGGKLEPSSGSCASDSELVGAVTVKDNVVPAETLILKISDWRIDTEEGMERRTIKFNDKRYWLFQKFDY